MKKVLICGASGFMGNNIINHLLYNTDYELYGVSNTHIPARYHNLKKLFTCDLTTQKGIEHVFGDIQYDVIIQAAATTSGAKDIIEKPYIHVTNNVLMNTLLLRAAFDYNVKQFIFLSCSVMYQPGDTPRKETDFNEHDEMFPTYFGVGSMKVYIEKQMQFYARLGRTKHLAIRHTNTYGPYDKYDYEHSHVLGATIRKVMDATNSIEVWGSGEETARDFVHAYDVSDFILKAIIYQKSQFDIVNVSCGEAITVKELVEKIVKASGKSLDVKYNMNKPIIPTKLALNNDRAISYYGWYPQITLDDGIKTTLQWYKEFYNK